MPNVIRGKSPFALLNPVQVEHLKYIVLQSFETVYTCTTCIPDLVHFQHLWFLLYIVNSTYSTVYLIFSYIFHFFTYVFFTYSYFEPFSSIYFKDIFYILHSEENKKANAKVHPNPPTHVGI